MNPDDTLPMGDGVSRNCGEDSVINLMRDLQSNRDEAAEQLWNRYFTDLVDVARRMLQGVPKGMADEEDVAASVFRTICRGGEQGRFDDLKSRDELWWLLLAITRQKAANYIRGETRQKRGDGRVRRESELGNGSPRNFSLENLIGSAPTPEFLALMQEEHELLLQALVRDDLKQIAAFRIAGYEVAEIAAEMNLCERSVLRKLALIRKVWERELEASSDAHEQLDPVGNA
jgi:DNA-directed RNA polymerase specialized sigma24 family protein